MSDDKKLEHTTRCRDCHTLITPDQYQRCGLCSSCVQKQEIKEQERRKREDMSR